jgi:hypothetical protein
LAAVALLVKEEKPKDVSTDSSWVVWRLRALRAALSADLTAHIRSMSRTRGLFAAWCVHGLAPCRLLSSKSAESNRCNTRLRETLMGMAAGYRFARPTRRHEVDRSRCGVVKSIK